MPTSSIADEITRLSACRNDILSAISAKGVTVPVGSVLSSCPSLIASITGGGGGEPTSFINTGFSATGRYEFTRPFTAKQVPVESYNRVEFEYSFSTAQIVGAFGVQNADTCFPIDGTPAELVFSGTKPSWATIQTEGIVYSASSINTHEDAIGRWTATTTTASLTASAQFTASAPAPTPFYIVFEGLTPWNFTAVQLMTGTKYIVTGTALPYPQYASSTEGVMSGETTGQEFWSGSTTLTCSLDRSASLSTTYNDGPSTSSAQAFPVESSISSYSAGQLQRYISQGSYGPTDLGNHYTYEYGAVNSGYTGYTGI